MTSSGIESSGQLTKLSRIEVALNFASSKFNTQLHVQYQQAVATYKLWKKTLQKERKITQKRKRPMQSENLPSSDYMRILTMSKPREFVEKALSASPITSPGFNRVCAYLAMKLYLRCVQRKSAVEGMTTSEFENAAQHTKDGKIYYLVFVSNHKTSATYGPAQLVNTFRNKASLR